MLSLLILASLLFTMLVYRQEVYSLKLKQRQQRIEPRLNKTLCHDLNKSNLAYFCIGYSAICDQVDEFYKQEKTKDDKLCNLFNALGSDKCTRHKYGYLYDFLFKEIRYQKLNILEIGLGSVEDKRFKSQMSKRYTPGASQRAWREYFPNSQIFGADINPDILFQEERIKTYYADITKNGTLRKMFDEIAVPLDIFIDDSLHEPGPQKNLFSVAFEKVKPGGFYVVEDIMMQTLCEEHYQHYIDLQLKDFAFIRREKFVNDGILSVVRKEKKT